jgi:hypothetical protein
VPVNQADEKLIRRARRLWEWWMGQSPTVKTVADAAAAVAAGYLLKVVLPGTAWDNPVMSAALLFGLTTVLRLMGTAGKLERDARSEREYRIRIEGLLDETSKISTGISRLWEAPFWPAYFREELKTLSASVHDAVDDECVPLFPVQQVRQLILREAADGPVRMIHFLEDENVWTNRYWRSFFRRTHDWVNERPNVRVVSRLFIYDDPSILMSSRVREMLVFHSNTTGFECRLLDRTEYNERRSILDGFDSHKFHDFGVYGSKMTWYWTGNVNAESGSFLVTSRDVVHRFNQWFTDCWNAADDPDQHGVGSQDTPLKVEKLLDKLAESPHVITAS